MASQWPASRDFVEAIQNPSNCFSDSELKALVPALDKLGMPIVTSGQFAYVFKLNSPNGGRAQAVRCFRGFIGDREGRYERINDHLDKVNIPYFASFEYDAQGILVNGGRYPTLVMEWITGSPLDLYIDSVLNRSDVLNYLAESWLRLLATLRASSTAHGDLQHGNIIIENNSFRLVDLDGLWVPAMAGWKASELGHRHYQHPKRTELFFDRNLDNFSGLVIYLSLLSLAQQPDLWAKFHDENLIFTKADFEDPGKSDLFRMVKAIGPIHRRLADQLETMCHQDPAKCVSVLDLVEPPPESKLPVWMQAVPIITVKTATREAGSQGGGSIVHPPPLSPPVVAATAGGRWWATAGSATGASQSSPPPLPRTGTPSANSRNSIRDIFRSPVATRMINYAWVGLLGIWIWYPLLHAFVLSKGGSSQVAGIGAIVIYLFACAILAFLAEDHAKAAAKTPVRPVPAPSIPATVPRPVPIPYRKPSVTPSPSPSAVVASNIRTVYHQPSCRWAGKISARNRRYYASVADARNAGLKPCGVCNP